MTAGVAASCRARALAGVAGAALLALLGCAAASQPAPPTATERPVLPPVLGLPVFMPVPDENPLTRGTLELGRALFFDPALSADRTISCATCHRPDLAFADSAAVARGIAGRRGTRNAPSLLNRGYGRSFFWDGRSTTLEEQVLRPIADPAEMGLPLERLAARLRGRPTYRTLRAQPADSAPALVARALAGYIRTLRTGNSAFDRWRAGDTTALQPAARLGLELFNGRARCSACHSGPNFTDEDFHNTGVGGGTDAGRAVVSGSASDVGAFKTPSLRSLARSAPYMHDGSLRTLADVIDFYDRGGEANPNLDAEIRPLHLTTRERAALLAFLAALEGEVLELLQAQASTDWTSFRTTTRQVSGPSSR